MRGMMKAMVLEQVNILTENANPLSKRNIAVPVPEMDEILIRVSTCGVCHTELDEIEGRTVTRIPVVPGHQIVGYVEKIGSEVSSVKVGDRVGVGWIWWACGKCSFCKSGNENLCSEFLATGRDVNGGYAEFMIARDKFVYPIPPLFSDEEAAPLLCAGAIGYRSLRLSGIKNGEYLGLTGFGASAHLVLKLAKYLYPSTGIFVFARNREEQKFALSLGADWTGDTDSEPPVKLNAIIDTTPAWKPVTEALKNLATEGRLIINAIRKEDADKSDLMQIDYARDLWMEKSIKSVANVSSKDISGFLKISAEIPLKPEIQLYSLNEANSALIDLKFGQVKGGKVLKIV
jgi:propanol-preferring alcohol dehydrogenase